MRMPACSRESPSAPGERPSVPGVGICRAADSRRDGGAQAGAKTPRRAQPTSGPTGEAARTWCVLIPALTGRWSWRAADIVLAVAPAAPVELSLMLTRIVCPNCGHVGATTASLPRVLTCSQCGHDALIRSGRPARSHITWEEDALIDGTTGASPRPVQKHLG
jgi:hypothetical protein